MTADRDAADWNDEQAFDDELLATLLGSAVSPALAADIVAALAAAILNTLRRH